MIHERNKLIKFLILKNGKYFSSLISHLNNFFDQLKKKISRMSKYQTLVFNHIKH